MGWETSDRRDDLPSWWPVTVRRIKKRDPVCRCPGCSKCTPVPGGPCGRATEEVDHLGARTDHRDVMLLGKCRPCHGRKSSVEGNAAQAAKKTPTGFFAEHPPGRL